MILCSFPVLLIIVTVAMIVILNDAEESESRADSITFSTVSSESNDLSDNSSMQQDEEKHSALINDFPEILQMPELPTKCEITALTMVLNYYGFDVDKVTLATEYLPTMPPELYYGSDGLMYDNDMENYFIGDPAIENGYICDTSAIVAAANTYLSSEGSSFYADDISCSSPDELYKYVSEGTPVVVWVTIGMNDRAEINGWYFNGQFTNWSVNDHGAVLIGYDESTVTIADPLAGITKYDLA